MKLEIQKLLSGKTLAEAEKELTDKYAIKAKRSVVYPELVLFKYNQIESPFAERIVQECRGIILDESNGWRVVSRSFDKFFNHGEALAVEVDWETAEVQEKVDGSLLTLYHHDGAWRVQTTGSPDAAGPVESLPMTFSQLFWETFHNLHLALREEAIGHSIMLELTSPFNRIVVNHRDSNLTLLGVRHLASGVEVGPAEAAEFFRNGHRPGVVKTFSLQSFDEIAATFPALSPLESEGYVVCDALFGRVKVKNPAYVALHHAKDGVSFRSMIDVARRGESSEVEVAFPEIGAKLAEIRGRIDVLVARVEGAYSSIAHIEEQKAFALCATKTALPAALFNLRAKKCASVREYVATMNVDNLAALLGYRVEEGRLAA